MLTHILIFVLNLSLVALIAASGSRFRPDAWYEGLRKPVGLPPKWVFPVVWSILYLMMAIASTLIWIQPDGSVRSVALFLYFGQLLANAAWSWLFFGRRQMGLALIDLITLLILVSMTSIAFFRMDTLAGMLLFPYLVWLMVALYLNAMVWWLNPKRSKGKVTR